ncbi:MAG TPA: MoxR family ATPase [Verrucomicrobiales bacterium]|nr:MoxR family ATPase [Verrucomicrobiales bacterium]
MPVDSDELKTRIADASSWVPLVRTELHRVLVGQESLVDRVFVALLTNGHILLEGVPGLAKTLIVKALAGTMSVSFKRFQFTPDLLPADLLGTLIYSPGDGSFKPKLGPIFANLILADEINRSPAKVQSALLEAMQERQVTIGDTTYKLPDPFMVMATQNPIDQEGTYQLPEAQLDRFLLKVRVDYPTKLEERQILDRMSTSSPMVDTTQVIDAQRVIEGRKLVNEIMIADPVKDYIVEIVHTSRNAAELLPEVKNLIRCGASPRGTINLALASRALAFLAGRSYVTPQDVKDLALDVLRHRILVTYEAEAEGVTSEQIISLILNKVPVP